MSYMPNRNLIFVVDDDPGTLRGVRRLLRQYGYDSELFPSAEAFEKHNDIEKAFCVILVPVIYMTGNDNPAVRKAALDSGCLAYLTKPFSAKSLIEPVKRASVELT